MFVESIFTFAVALWAKKLWTRAFEVTDATSSLNTFASCKRAEGKKSITNKNGHDYDEDYNNDLLRCKHHMFDSHFFLLCIWNYYALSKNCNELNVHFSQLLSMIYGKDQVYKTDDQQYIGHSTPKKESLQNIPLSKI